MKSSLLRTGSSREAKWILGLAFCLCGALATHAQKEYDNVLQRWYLYRSDPNALYRHIVEQAKIPLKSRSDSFDAIRTLPEFKKHQLKAKKTLLDAIGPFPDRTPLNARVVRTIEKDFYRLEHILFESQPGFFVTASLFVPRSLKGRAPAIVYCSGHSASGYKSRGYQQVLLNLAKKGFVVLAFDPVGQGERVQYLNPQNGRSKVGGSPTREHFMGGTQSQLTGTPFARTMMWDGIRAVDYLVSRPEVDPARIGMTGRSGGGTQTAFIGALDDRILAAAPECYITDFTRMLESNGPPDPEQTLPDLIGRGFDEPDFLIIRAPKPTLVITTTNDIFNIQGAKDTFRQAARVYDAYGKKENFNRVEDLAAHASTRKNREAMYAFFQQALQNPGSAAEDSVGYLKPEEINVTVSGQVATELKGETVFDQNMRTARRQLDQLNRARRNPAVHIPAVIAQAKKLSGYRTPDPGDEPVMAGAMVQRKIRIEKYFIGGEGNYVIPYLLFKPANPNNRSVLYLAPRGKATVAANAEVDSLVRDGFEVLIPDLIGAGETGPGNWAGDKYFQHVRMEGLSLAIWSATYLVGRSVTGIRAGDIVRLVHLLKRSGAGEIAVIARKEAAPAALHAAVFDKNISRLALIEPCLSYYRLATTEYYHPDLMEAAVPSALTAYDLPDLMAAFAPAKLLLVNPVNGEGKSASEESVAAELEFAASVYGSSGAMTLYTEQGEGPALSVKLQEWLH